MAGSVLVLDDDEALREMLVEALALAGYRAVGLAAGGEALDRLAEIDPDLILLDMMMPRMDGFEFLARLRAHSPRPDVPVLIVSDLGDFLAQNVDADAVRTLRLAGILPKGMPLAQLVARVEYHLGPPLRPEA